MADHIDKTRYAHSEASGPIPIDLQNEFRPEEFVKELREMEYNHYHCSACDLPFPRPTIWSTPVRCPNCRRHEDVTQVDEPEE